MEQKFNAIYEPWIPTIYGKVGLWQIFSDDNLKNLGGNPIEKISVFKLLLAIAQSAFTPKDEDEWKSVGKEGFRKKVLEYLEKNKDLFWLYGDKPFLQMSAVKNAATVPFGAVKMEIATGNSTVVTEIQKEKKFDDAEKLMILLCLVNFACGGKKTDKSVVLSSGYEKKSGGSGTSLGFMGYLHSFFFADSIFDSVYLNLFTEEDIENMQMFDEVGTAPWLLLPNGEDDEIAQKLKKSYMGRLISMNRFFLIDENNNNLLHYTEGIRHPDYSSKIIDPSVAMDKDAKPKPKVLWSNPERKPWRQLDSLLSFMDAKAESKFRCNQLLAVKNRLKNAETVTIWSGGVKVSSNAGEQYLTGGDDFVESEVTLYKPFCNEDKSYERLKSLLQNMNDCSKSLWGAIKNYFADLKMIGDDIAKNVENDYWQLCESKFQSFLKDCFDDNDGEKIEKTKSVFYSFAYQLYDEYCTRDTARQMEAWANNRFRKKGEK